MKVEYPDEWFTEEELFNTPGRFNRFLEEWKKKQAPFHFTTFPVEDRQTLVTSLNIDFYSLCAHHLLPFYGKVHIGYVPGSEVCGISKLSRTVDMFASRPQQQERMTKQIADYLVEALNPAGVIVVVEGAHLCMRMRGVQKQNAVMTTSAVRGLMMSEPKLKSEFMSLIRPGAL